MACFARALGEDECDICVKHEDSPWHMVSVHCPDTEALPGPSSELLLPFLVALVSHLIPVTEALWAYFLSKCQPHPTISASFLPPSALQF